MYLVGYAVKQRMQVIDGWTGSQGCEEAVVGNTGHTVVHSAYHPRPYHVQYTHSAPHTAHTLSTLSSTPASKWLHTSLEFDDFPLIVTFWVGLLLDCPTSSRYYITRSSNLKGGLMARECLFWFNFFSTALSIDSSASSGTFPTCRTTLR